MASLDPRQPDAYRQALAQDGVAATWTSAMRAGDWEAAWQQTDRIELPRRAQQQAGGFVRGPQHLVWDGTPLAQRRVLVRCLHGLGDTLQFMRLVPAVQRQARELHFLVQPPLLDLLRGAPGLGLVSSAWTDHPPPCDVEIEVMELAYALRVRPDTVAPPYPYLREQLKDVPGVQLTRARRLRVGLLWAASDWDRSRTVPLTSLAPLLHVPDVSFYSLQQGEAAHDPALAALGVATPSTDTRDIKLAAAAMLEMDLVISVDGMPAHLAATLSRPTWLMLKHDADWRWMPPDGRTPWYPSMRLFRQRRPGDWDSVACELARALKARTSHASFRAD